MAAVPFPGIGMGTRGSPLPLFSLYGLVFSGFLRPVPRCFLIVNARQTDIITPAENRVEVL
jgi:hypothetical protein